MTMKAYSLLEVKEVSDEQRVIKGMATTPTVDRMGDIVEPEGAQFHGPINLHLYHSHQKPVGNVQFGKATKSGIPFTASIPEVPEEGTVRERVNEAWHSVKYKLLGAVSIGFRAMEDGVELLKSGGLRFTKWEMLELSLVSVPANPDALIQSFKSADSGAIRDVLGLKSEIQEERQRIVDTLTKGAVPLIPRAADKPQPLPGGAIRLNK